MLSIMIVDDEPVIRFGIKASVDWEKEGFVVVGDYANGAEALEHLKSNHVDILFTDIKMPVMDGLTLTQHAMELDPHIKVILVSSYNDFEYVHQGLRLGVVDYILKHTLEPDELLSIAQKCGEMITEEIRLENRLVDAHEHVNARQRARYARAMKHYLANRTDELPLGGYPQWLSGSFSAVYVHLHGIRKLEETNGFLYTAIVVEHCLETFNRAIPESIAVPTEAGECFIVLPEHQEIERILAELHDEFVRETGASLTFGYQLGNGIADIMRCYAQSKAACGSDFFEGAGIYAYDARKADYTRLGCHLPSLLPSPLILSEGSLELIVSKWRADWLGGGASPAALKEEACRTLTMIIKHNVDSFALVDAFERLFESESLESLCECLIEECASLVRHTIVRSESADLNNPVEKALSYIQAHYLDAVNLQQVADHVHVSKNYFSILFKKLMGQNFIDYLIELRIQKAKEMLAQSNLRVYEVAEQAGFNDVKYFSKLFKKMTGLTPMDYREYHLMDSGYQAGSDPS